MEEERQPARAREEDDRHWSNEPALIKMREREERAELGQVPPRAAASTSQSDPRRLPGLLSPHIPSPPTTACTTRQLTEVHPPAPPRHACTAHDAAAAVTRHHPVSGSSSWLHGDESAAVAGRPTYREGAGKLKSVMTTKRAVVHVES